MQIAEAVSCSALPQVAAEAVAWSALTEVAAYAIAVAVCGLF